MTVHEVWRPVTRRRGPWRPHPLLTFVVVIVVLFVAVDRIAAAMADRLVADKIQSAENLADRPDVSIRGFPLLTQVIRQRYSEVDVKVRDFRRGSLDVTALDVHLEGVQVPTSILFGGHPKRIPVDTATGTARMSFRALDTMLRGHGLTVSYAGPGLLRVRGTVSVAGHPFPVSATAQVRVEGEDLVLSPRDISSGDASSIVGDALLSVIRDRLTLRLPLSALPFHVRLVSVQVAKDGVRVSARSDGFVLNIG